MTENGFRRNYANAPKLFRKQMGTTCEGQRVHIQRKNGKQVRIFSWFLIMGIRVFLSKLKSTREYIFYISDIRESSDILYFFE